MKTKRNNIIDRILENMYREMQSLDNFVNSQFDFPQKLVSGKPYFYGYTMEVGPDGRPIVHEFGNIDQKNNLQSPDLQNPDSREPLVDVLEDSDGNKIRIVAELPGVQKEDIKITETQGVVNIKAENENRKYNTDVPTGKQLDTDKSKTKFTNGILELEIPLKKSEDEKNIQID